MGKPFRLLALKLKPSGGQLRPAVLYHIGSAECVDRIHISRQHSVVVAIQHLPADGQLPPLTDDILLGTVYGALVLGVGLGLILRGGATTGGSDMVARMVHNKFPIVSVGMFLFMVDCAVILCAAFTMSAKAALYALICIFVNAKAVDLVLAGFGSAKACFIITKHGESMAQRIMKELDRGATMLSATGAYSGEGRTVLISVVSQREVIPLKKIVRMEDAKAFVFITDTHETLGEGFSALSGE